VRFIEDGTQQKGKFFVACGQILCNNRGIVQLSRTIEVVAG